MATSTRRKGSALLLATIVTFTVAVLALSFLSLSLFQGKFTTADIEREKAFYICEAGINQAMFELNAGEHDGESTWSITEDLGHGNFSVDVEEVSAGQFRLISTGTFGAESRRLEVVTVHVPSTLSITGMGAIVNLGPLTTSGNITVDGRDWDIDGNSVVGPGTYGVVTGGTLTQSGSSDIGGNGTAPTGNADSTIVDENHDWSADGVDNDNDGEIDEAGEGFPASPDQALGLPAGTLKSIAQSQGTYFASQTEFDDYRNDNGGNLPGGKIFFLEFDSLVPAKLGSGMNDDPSILVMHNATSNAVMKNIHGDFKGLILSDEIDHINSGSDILGMIVSWHMGGNAYGNGNSDVRFSSAVLNALPSAGDTPEYSIVSWRESP